MENYSENETRFRDMFNNMQSGAAIYEAVDNGSDFIFRDFNPAAEVISRISRDKVLNKRLLDLFPNMDKTALFSTLKRVYQTGQPEHIPAFFYKDKEREGWRQNFVFKLETGEVVAIYNDITEIKTKELEIKRHNDDLAFLNSISFRLAGMTAIGDIERELMLEIKNYTGATLSVFSIYNEESKSLFVNQFDSDQFVLDTIFRVIGKKISEFGTELTDYNRNHMIETTVGFCENLVEATFGGIPSPVDKTIKALTGISRYYGLAHSISGRLYGSTLLGFKNGQSLPSPELLKSYAHLAALAFKRKMQDNEIREKEFVIAESQKIGHIGSWLMDVVGDRLTWSDEVFRIFGVDRASFTPSYTHFLMLVHPEDRALVDKTFRESLEMYQSSYELEHRIITKADNKTRIVLEKCTHERDHSGKVIRSIGIVQDITDRKQTEDALLHAQKLETLGLLSAGIAHDFNNLMQGIYAHVEVAYHGTSEENTRKSLAGALTTISRASGLSRQLLTFSAGGAPVKKTGTISAIVSDVASFALSGSNVSLSCNMTDDLWVCDFDSNQISQVIENLVINARQSMPNGGKVEITTKNMKLAEGEHTSLHAGNYVAVTVRDFGCGIPQSAITRIFDPFFTTKVGGHGLGLSICYSVVKRHGGTLEVERLDNGSAFTFYLPAVAGVIMDSSTAAATEHKGQGLFLLMDDEEVVLESVGSMLRYFGYEVVEKNEGSAAVDFVMNTMRENVQLAGMMFDLTISGGMGGKEAIHAIRAFCPDIPAIVMSGYSENGEIVRPEEFGFNASISKPFNMKQLSETLNRVYCK